MEHPRYSTFDRSTYQWNLREAGSLQKHGDHAQAANLLRQNLEMSSKHFSGIDLIVLDDRDRLSDCLRRLGDLKGAVEIDEVTLALRQRLYNGAEDTVVTQQGLADNLSNLGQHDRAIPLHRSALSTREKTLGSNHRITLQIKHSLAWSLHEVDQTLEASRINGQILEVEEKILTPDNHDLVATVHNLAKNSYALGDLERARQLTLRNIHALQDTRTPTDKQLLAAIVLQTQIKSAVSEAKRQRAMHLKRENLITPRQDHKAASASHTPQQPEVTTHNMLLGAKTHASNAVHGQRQARVNHLPKTEASARKSSNKGEAEILKREADDREKLRSRMAVNNKEAVNVSSRPDTRLRSDRLEAVTLAKPVLGDATPLVEQPISSSNRRKDSDWTRDAQETPELKMSSNIGLSGNPGSKMDRPRVSHSVSEKLGADKSNGSRLVSPTFTTDPQARPKSSDERRLDSSKPEKLTIPTTPKPRSRSIGAFPTGQNSMEGGLKTSSDVRGARSGKFYDHTFSRARTGWLNRFQETQILVAQGRKPQQRRVKIAILDTGVDLGHPFFQNATGEHQQYSPSKDRLRECRSFVHGEAGYCDRAGHGTQCTALLMDLAPNADIYVGRISAGGRSQLDPEAVAKAIIHAADEWKVAIISMSFGWTERHDSVADAIDRAVARGVLLCAAASNEGANDGVAFPARLRPVICVHSTNENGKPSDFTPNAVPSEHNFAVVGENVQAAGPGRKDGHSLTGTSVATPILAAVMALIIEFVDQKPRKTPEEKRIKDHRVMTQVLSAMSEKVSGYDYVRPWELMNGKKWDRGRNESNIQRSIEKV